MLSRTRSPSTKRTSGSNRPASLVKLFVGWADRAALVVLMALMLFGSALVVRKYSTGATVIGGSAWAESFSCNFARGWCPAGWGWGEWEIAGGLLRGRAPAEQVAVYFFCQRAALEPAPHLQPAADPPRPSGSIGNSDQPCAPFDHSGDFLLETRVRLRAQPGLESSEAQLLIRDGSEAREGAGVTVRAGRESIRVRYRTDGQEHVYRTIPLSRRNEFDRWYRVRFAARDGRVTTYMDGQRVFDSGDAVQSGRRVLDSSPDFRTRYRVVGGGEGSHGQTLPPGTFAEPHIAVRGGVAEFEYVKLYVPRQ